MSIVGEISRSAIYSLLNLRSTTSVYRQQTDCPPPSAAADKGSYDGDKTFTLLAIAIDSSSKLVAVG